jgi:hypothetical protein
MLKGERQKKMKEACFNLIRGLKNRANDKETYDVSFVYISI